MVSRRFQGSGDAIVLFGDGHGELGGSEYLKVVCNLVRGVPPSVDLVAERALQDLIVALSDDSLIRSAHDCSDGGLAVAVAECCFDRGGMGAEISIAGTRVSNHDWLNDAAALFGESASRVVVSVTPDALASVLERAAMMKVPARVIGQTGGNRLRMAVDGRMVIEHSVDDAERMWSTAVGQYFARRVA